MEVLNPRTRLLCVAFKQGLINAEELDEPEKNMFEWLDKSSIRWATTTETKPFRRRPFTGIHRQARMPHRLCCLRPGT
ncbi:MAG: hypothetical protein U0105_11405 [Candidatus Obscuribacterales bacterium]